MTGRQRLTLGNFLLSDGPEPVDSGRGYTVITLSEGLSFGEPTPIVVGIASLIEAGALVAINGWDNRTGTTFQVTIEGDSRALARAEKDLRAEMGSAPRGGINNVLAWEPPDGLGDPTAFDVLVSELKRSDNGVPNDFAETFHHTRTWLIELTCLPWARSVNKVKISSQLVTGGTITTLDACDSTAGWSTANAGPYSVVSIDGRTALRVGPDSSSIISDGKGNFSSRAFARRELSGITEYLSADVRFEQPADTIRMTPDPPPGALGQPEAIEALPDGWVRAYFETSAARGFSASGPVVFQVYANRDSVTAVQFHIDNIQARDTLPAQSGKASLSTIRNRGSEEAPMSLHVGRDLEALGDTLVATWPDLRDGFTPGIKKFQTAANPFRALIPARSLRPGSYEVVLSPSAVRRAGNLVFRTFGVVGQNVLIPPPTGTGYSPAGRGVTLPINPGPPESNQMIEIIHNGTLDVGDIFLIPRDDESATTAVLDAPRNIWIESASAGLPRGAVYVGTAADKTDALAAGTKMTARGRHRMAREGTAVFVAAESVSAPPLVEAEHYLTFHSHVILEDDDG